MIVHNFNLQSTHEGVKITIQQQGDIGRYRPIISRGKNVNYNLCYG
jgi:hypothetical protein